MAVSVEEKLARRARAKRRREAKEAGTYVPRGQRKAKARRDLTSKVSSKVYKPRSQEEIEETVKRRRAGEPKRLKRRFRTSEPILIKARIQSHVIADEGGPRYYVMPISSLYQREGVSWIINESYLAPWPRRKK